ncbi:unnamed protein product [Didymodactylos carnosus]|uniref:RING-type domain-containing protein n=1 Tax=Didymodactylos carnosus TaxID=1234261 RepID=A0A814FN20_9BILA|nr:unnamed protein product [Didymodactylos carnosus]CAF1004878.1 unnamed protein product [Didymodactylos carnosus]CAF3760043.1 unnamed protein product [Didymodactylos carnosus]CAF3774116.1 unnamed protein product [Didymodactylos carnosus]
MAALADITDKPNLRPTKQLAAGGKTIYKHHNPNKPSTRSYIHASWNETASSSSIPGLTDPFSIRNQNVQYSLNKRQNWNLLQQFRNEIANESTSSSESEEEAQQRIKKKKSTRPHKTKYRLYEFHNTNLQANCVGITSSGSGKEKIQRPQKTYMQTNVPNRFRANNSTNTNTNVNAEVTTNQRQQQQRQQQAARTNRQGGGNEADEEDEQQQYDQDVDVTYYASVPPPRENKLANVRKSHGKSKKTKGSTQRARFNQIQENIQLAQHVEQDSDEPPTPETSSYPSSVPKLMLDSFIQPVTAADENADSLQSSSIIINLETEHDPKASIIYVPNEKERHDEHRKELLNLSRSQKVNNTTTTSKKLQRTISREEKLYNRAMKQYMKSGGALPIREANGDKELDFDTLPNKKSHTHSMEMSFRSVLLNRSSVQFDNMINEYGKNFVDAKCYPLKYLIRITDHVKQAANRFKSHWEELIKKSTKNKLINPSLDHCFDLFPLYCTLDTYLVIVFDDDEQLLPVTTTTTSSSSEYLHARVAINIDVYSDTLELENLNDSVPYTVNDLIEKAIDFVTMLPFDTFKPIDNELHRRKFKQNVGNDMSDSEFVNHQIKQIQLIDRNTKNATTKTEEKLEEDFVPVEIEEYELVKPSICTTCYRDMDQTVEATALRECAHWLCNDCWKQYLEMSVKRVTICLCPEWNCSSLVDVGKQSNHMTCSCGAEFCWTCYGWWREHTNPETGAFKCPQTTRALQEETLVKQRNDARKHYFTAITHRRERLYELQQKRLEHAKRLISTIPFEKVNEFSTDVIQKQIDKREALLKHAKEMAMYLDYLHRICEFVAVSADGYGNNEPAFSYSLSILETCAFNMSQTLEGGKGTKAIDQLKEFHNKCQKEIERLRRAVALRDLRLKTGYMTG